MSDESPSKRVYHARLCEPVGLIPKTATSTDCQHAIAYLCDIGLSDVRFHFYNGNTSFGLSLPNDATTTGFRNFFFDHYGDKEIKDLPRTERIATCLNRYAAMKDEKDPILTPSAPSRMEVLNGIQRRKELGLTV